MFDLIHLNFVTLWWRKKKVKLTAMNESFVLQTRPEGAVCVCVCEPCQPLARVKRSALFHMSQCKNLIKISDFTEKKKKQEVSVGSSEGKTTRPVVRTPTKILNT